MSDGEIHVGTSGWHYDHWRGPFYPEDADSETYLSRYVEVFATVEINTSFYHLPERETLERWTEVAPEGFVFAAKASRYITHMKKLKDPAEPVARFFGRMETLGGMLGPVLFQLPPNWHRNLERLERFLDVLPEDRRCAFEFRDASWWDTDTFALLENRGVAHCLYDVAGQGPPRVVTTDFAYIRFHGATDSYRGRYRPKDLAGWAGACASWARSGRDVYVYFNNDTEGHAVENARRFAEMVHADDPSKARSGHV